jgi:hypothetical protein
MWALENNILNEEISIPCCLRRADQVLGERREPGEDGYRSVLTIEARTILTGK